MNLNDLERKFRKFSISNITLYVSIGMAIVYFMSLINPYVINVLSIDPDKIFQGQIWRLITFIFIPTSGNPMLLLFEILFFYWVGTALENDWGSFRFTLYYLGGILGTTLAVIIGHLIGGNEYLFSYSVSSYFTMNLFLAFAWYHGEEVIRLMFILPIKIKFLAIFDTLLLIYTIISTPTWEARMLLLFSMLNLIIFYSVVLTRRAKNKGRYLNFKMKTNKAEGFSKKKPRHRCVLCGKTDISYPDMTFRYCSKCEGDYEFCEEHIYSHDHFKKIVEFKKMGDDNK